MGNCNSIAVRIPNHEGICGLIDALGQPFASASLQHADEVRDYTTDLNEIEQDWDSIVDLFIHSGFGGNKPSTVVDLFGNTPDIIHQEGRGVLYNKKNATRRLRFKYYDTIACYSAAAAIASSNKL